MTRMEETSRKTSRKHSFQHCNVKYFARDCIMTSFQMGRSIEKYIRACQNFSCSHTYDILNILTGSILENRHDEEPVIMRVEEQFSDEGLAHDEWSNHLKKNSKSRLEACQLQKAYVFSDPLF